MFLLALKKVPVLYVMRTFHDLISVRMEAVKNVTDSFRRGKATATEEQSFSVSCSRTLEQSQALSKGNYIYI